MNQQLFIPKKIKVGYQERFDCYTKRLAYVIYYDSKGVLRKETSWKGWIDKGNKTGNYYDVLQRKYLQHPDHIREPLPTDDFDNVPTEGFVLNKKAGGTKYGWNPRATYSRVFDPRGFEFEISIPNLLFILSETNCHKGKGLEGDFVYAWDNKDLVLLPVGCTEYKECKKFTALQSEKINVKDLISGCSYQTKKQENLIYIGKFPWYACKYSRSDNDKDWGYIMKKENPFIFYTENKSLHLAKSLDFLAIKNSDVPVSNFAEIMEEVSKNTHFRKPIGLESESKKVDLTKYTGNNNWLDDFCYKPVGDNEFKQIRIYKENKYDTLTQKYKLAGYYFNINHIISFINEKLYRKNPNSSYEYKDGYGYSYDRKLYSEDEINAMMLQELYVLLDNGEKVLFHKFD